MGVRNRTWAAGVQRNGWIHESEKLLKVKVWLVGVSGHTYRAISFSARKVVTFEIYSSFIHWRIQDAVKYQTWSGLDRVDWNYFPLTCTCSPNLLSRTIQNRVFWNCSNTWSQMPFPLLQKPADFYIALWMAVSTLLTMAITPLPSDLYVASSPKLNSKHKVGHE